MGLNIENTFEMLRYKHEKKELNNILGGYS